MSEISDFGYLCAAAERTGHHVELTVDDGERNRDGEVTRRRLRSIRITDKDGGLVVASPINGNGLEVAARIALRRLSESTA